VQQSQNVNTKITFGGSKKKANVLNKTKKERKL